MWQASGSGGWVELYNEFQYICAKNFKVGGMQRMNYRMCLSFIQLIFNMVLHTLLIHVSFQLNLKGLARP